MRGMNGRDYGRDDKDDADHTVQLVLSITLGLVLLGALMSWWGG